MLPRTEHETETLTDAALIEASLEAVALSDKDIVPLFFERFYAAYPEQRDCFSRPNATQGTMVNEMLSFLAALAANEPWVEKSIADCIAKHQSYGDVTAEKFEGAISILIEVMTHEAGPNWCPAYSDLWNAAAHRFIDYTE